MDIFENSEEAALAWELKIDTIQPMFSNHDPSLSKSGCSVKTYNDHLIKKLADPKYSRQVREKTINALQNGAFVKSKIEEEANEEKGDVSFLFSSMTLFYWFFIF